MLGSYLPGYGPSCMEKVCGFQYYVKNMRALFSFVFHIHFLRGAEGDLNPNLNGRFRLSRFENHVLLVILLNGCLSLPRVWL